MDDTAFPRFKIDGTRQQTTEAITDPSVFTATNFLPPKELEIETSIEQGKKLVGFLVLVPRTQTRTVGITYEIEKAFSLQDVTWLYDLWVFKQPGTEADQFTFSLTFPATYTVLKASPALNNVGGKVMYTGVLSQDQKFQAEFSKK